MPFPSNRQSQQQYRALCEAHPNSIPLFSQAWWLDIAAQEGFDWDAIVVEENQRIVAALPYGIRRKYVLNWLCMPPFCQQFHVFIAPPPTNLNAYHQATYSLQLVEQLAVLLPAASAIQLNLDFDAPSMLPFLQRGYVVANRFGYRLDDLSDFEAVEQLRSPRLRNAIRANRDKLIIEPCDDCQTLYRIVSLSFARQSTPMPFSLAHFQLLHQAVAVRQQGQMWLARTQEGVAIAGFYLVWDHDTAYGLLAGFDPQYKTAQATSVLYDYAIRYAAQTLQLRRFDFVGSSNPTIEPARRKFGATLRPYAQLNKTNHVLLRLYYSLLNK
jgi:hypothetical protein